MSHDAGQHFAVAPTAAIGGAYQAEIDIHDGAIRILALFGGQGPPSADVLAYSDDLGSSWRKVALAGSPAEIQLIRALAPNHLIASMTVVRNVPTYVFVCSSDGGSTWSNCG